MASESCEICGEETDANIIDEHGHFSGSGEDECEVCGGSEEDHSDDHAFEPA